MWLITTVTSSSYAVKYSLPCSNKIFEPLWWEFGCVDTDAVIGLAAFNFVGRKFHETLYVYGISKLTAAQ